MCDKTHENKQKANSPIDIGPRDIQPKRKRSINKIPCSKVNIILKVTSYILNNVLKVGHNQLFVHFTIVMCGALYGCWKLTTRCGDWTDYQLWS